MGRRGSATRAREGQRVRLNHRRFEEHRSLAPRFPSFHPSRGPDRSRVRSLAPAPSQSFPSPPVVRPAPLKRGSGFAFGVRPFAPSAVPLPLEVDPQRSRGPPRPNRVRTSTRSTSTICHLIISRIAATRYSGRQRSGPGPGTSAETQTLPPAVTCPVYHSHRGATTRTNGGESGKEATSKMISRRSEAGAPWRAWNAARSALSRSPPGRDASKS